MINPDSPYDPKLKKAMEEIKEILDKHRIAGIVGLASETHAEFLVQFPHWCVVKMVARDQVQIKSKRENYSSVAEQHYYAEASAHVIFRFSDIAIHVLRIMEHIKGVLRQHWDIQHESDGFTPHQGP